MLATDHSEVVVTDPAAMLLNASSEWKHIAGSVEPFLQVVNQQMAKQISAFDPGIASYADYALSNQGKQLRPMLVALSANATGQLNDSHALVAVIIEMVHLATLVHDDVIDEAELRRSRPTLAANWGNEISVLVGDCLFAHALKLAASFPTTDICRAVASATNTVCSGEIIQTQLKKDFNLTRSAYFKVLRMKTGELFALSCELGAYVSGAEPALRSSMRQFGMALGTAYQVFDDCLDLFGSETSAGKSLGTDLAKGKLTLPMLILLENVPTAERALVQSLVRQWEPRHFPKIMKLLREYRALELSRQAMDQYAIEARQAIAHLPASESQSQLLGLIVYLTQQVEALAASAV